jgi:hypothetical protein
VVCGNGGKDFVTACASRRRGSGNTFYICTFARILSSVAIKYSGNVAEEVN